MTFIYYLFLFLFLFLAVVLMLSILVQESKTTSLGASFGGDSGDSLFGTSTPEVLKKFTAIVAALFLGGCIILSFWTGTLGRSQVKTTTPSEVLEK